MRYETVNRALLRVGVRPIAVDPHGIMPGEWWLRPVSILYGESIGPIKTRRTLETVLRAWRDWSLARQQPLRKCDFP